MRSNFFRRFPARSVWNRAPAAPFEQHDGSATKPSKTARKRAPAKKRWSQRVTERSNALDLEGGLFTWRNPSRIAASLKRSAEHSKRRKADPYRSAMSMLTFYINRAGKDLPAVHISAARPIA